MQEQQAQLERAYARSSEKTLIREGVVLAGLKGNAEGRLYGDMVWSFQPARAAGGDLPPHKFKGGSSVTLKVSRGGNKKLGAIEGTVVDVHPIYVRVALGSQAALQLGEAQAQGGRRSMSTHNVIIAAASGALTTLGLT